MILSLGFKRETIVEAQNVRMITPEIYECDCPECEGTGDWSRFYPEPVSVPMLCISCKGTGKVYV